MVNDVKIITERIIRDGVAVLLQQVHYVNLKKIVTRELDANTGLPKDILKVTHILQVDEEPALA